AVAHPVDQVDEVFARGRLGEPVLVLETRDESCVAERARRRDDLRRLEEQVEVLRLAINASVFVNRVRTRDDVADAGGIERTEGTAIDLALVVGDPEITVRERLAFFGCQASR